MRIKKIRLENIRSYKSGEIEIPKGNILFTGDIGCGKTTLLLALEFALFGIRQGGPSLLRHGESSGSVDVFIELDKNEFQVKRSLKRSKNGVKTDECFLGFNNEFKKISATELKQKVIEFLGYPGSVLTKTKPLIYRYTVYTPQEEMKSIMWSDSESRLETIRKIFDVDKYKLVRENTKIFSSFLKNKKKELEGRFFDLEDKKEELIEIKKKEIEVREQIKKIEPIVKKLKCDLKEVKDLRESKEKELEEFKENKKKLEMLELTEKNLLSNIQKSKSQIEELKEDIKNLSKELDNKDVSDQKEKIEILKKDILDIENEINSKKESKFSILKEIEIIQKTNSKIQELDVCPTCEQNVTDDYKKKIFSTNESSLVEKKKFLEELNKIIESKDNNKKELLEKKEALEKKAKEFEIFKFKKEELGKKRLKLENLEKDISDTKKIIGDNNVLKKELFSKLEGFDQVSKDYELIKSKEEDVRKIEREESMKLIAVEESKKSIVESKNRITKEIVIKENQKIKASKINSLVNFFENEFYDTLSDIEKNVLVKIHSDFNSLFIKWFDILVGSEDLKVRIDFSFNPLIEQNGYETDYGSLSGGEKTACALAYRLALNQAINRMAETIKTKDLLILDEPTDGFSAEQLERLKLVLDELENNQVIIVSHEKMIENFVDKVFRFEKVGGKTSVV